MARWALIVFGVVPMAVAMSLDAIPWGSASTSALNAANRLACDSADMT
jgi:hypothetical protein